MNIFNDVKLLLSKLSFVGIGQMRIWRKDELGYISSTPYYEFGSESDRFLKNNLAFYVESPVEESVKVIKLMLNVNNNKEAEDAQKEYARVAGLTFDILNIPVPEGLQTALEDGQSFLYESELLSVINEVHNDRIDWYKLKITSK